MLLHERRGDQPHGPGIHRGGHAVARAASLSPHLRVQRLPIEAISQDAPRSAGRCGRVADNVCIRLY
ncbi:MAG: hypothetical protein H6806_09405 [Planctomycetes bacterium]|nr:hypothetical protein [Planctomycetota bacterium]